MECKDVGSLKQALDRVVSNTNGLAARSLDAERDSVLELVVSRGPIGSKELAVSLDLPPSLVLRNLRALAESGLVVAVDHRRTAEPDIVAATPTGREEVRRITEARCHLLGVIVQDWGADDTAALTALLTRLAVDCSAFRRKL